jgi:ribosome-binding factor A
MPTRRIEKINEMLKRAVSEIVQREMKDPRLGFTTVSRVETSQDLCYATVFASVMGNETDRRRTIERLNKAAGYIQHQLSGRIRLKTMPRITFRLDTSIDHSMRIDEILRKISEPNAAQQDEGKEDK